MTILQKFIIRGNSMLPTFKPGDTVLASFLPYLFSNPKLNDIVTCLDPRDKRILIKRIKKIENEKYFVCGDNLNASIDSRKFGMIYRRDIVGKVFYTVKI